MKLFSFLFDIYIRISIFALQLSLGMVKLVDTPDLGSGAARCEGSSPFTHFINPLMLVNQDLKDFFLYFSVYFRFSSRPLGDVQPSIARICNPCPQSI